MNAPAKEVFATLGHELTMTRAMLDGAQALIESSEHTVGDDSLLHAQKLVLAACRTQAECQRYSRCKELMSQRDEEITRDHALEKRQSADIYWFTPPIPPFF